MGSEKQANRLADLILIDAENVLVVARGGGYESDEMDESGQKVQTFTYKIN